jgi:RNA polymerase sigma-70 factor (ECF subfamily)
LLGDLNEAQNVLQETNMVLWRRSADFADGTGVAAWARKVADYQALARPRFNLLVIARVQPTRWLAAPS